MDIRLARYEDVPAILTISNDAAAHTIANFAFEPEPLDAWQSSFRATQEMYPWFVAEDASGAVVGFAKGSPWLGRCAYAYAVEMTIYVHPDHQGRGLGSVLYRALLDTVREQGYCTALGGIAQPNPASVRLHESLGMKRVALLERVGWKFGSWHDVGYWQMHLRDDDGPPSAIKPVAEAWSQVRVSRP